MTSHHQFDAFDCGDGVPNLSVATRPAPAGPERPSHQPSQRPSQRPVGARPAVLVLTLIGQLALLLAVLAGGNPLIGAVASVALLGCGLAVLAARALLDQADRSPRTDHGSALR